MDAVHSHLGGKAGVVDVVDVIRTRGRNRIPQTESELGSRLVHRERLPLHLDGKLPGLASPRLDAGIVALCQEIADPLSRARHLQQRHHRLRVAEVELDAAGVLLGDQPVLETLHGEGYHHSAADGVQALGIADGVPLGNRLETGHAAIGAQCTHRLVLGATEHGVGLELAFLDLHDPLAAHHARVAGAPVLQNRLGHRGARDLVRLIEVSGLEVARRKRPPFAQIGQAAIGPVLLHPSVPSLAVTQKPLGNLSYLRRIGDLLLARALGCHGLEELGPHHGTHSRTARGMVQILHHAGIDNLILPGLPDHGETRVLLAQFRLDHLLGIDDVLTPQLRGIPDFDLVILDPEVDRFLGTALHDQRVVTRPNQLDRKEPADVPLSESPCKGALRTDRRPTTAR